MSDHDEDVQWLYQLLQHSDEVFEDNEAVPRFDSLLARYDALVAEHEAWKRYDCVRRHTPRCTDACYLMPVCVAHDHTERLMKGGCEMSDHVIGSCDWNACMDCGHSDPVEGGCDLDDAGVALTLSTYGDNVICDSWDERTDPEDVTP